MTTKTAGHALRRLGAKFAIACAKTLLALTLYLGTLGALGYGAYAIVRGDAPIKILDLVDHGMEWLRPAEKRDTSAWLTIRVHPRLRGAAGE